jgi:hypothetical protein
MTLKEKFKLISCSDCDMPYCDIKCTILAPSELIKLEQIAEEFAIGFAEWCLDENHIILNDGKQLLEIYKKEKGL